MLLDNIIMLCQRLNLCELTLISLITVQLRLFISKKILPVQTYQRPVRLLFFEFQNRESFHIFDILAFREILQNSLICNFFNLYAYSFWKVSHPVRLLKTTVMREIRVGQRLSVYWQLIDNSIEEILHSYLLYRNKLQCLPKKKKCSSLRIILLTGFSKP